MNKYGWRATLLIVTEFFLTFSFFLFVPFISLYVTGELGYSLTFAGALLALRLVGQQGFMMFGGYFGDKFGYKRMMFIGFLCRGIGFAGIGLVESYGFLLIMGLIGGLGGALFSPALKSLLIYNQPKKYHRDLFSYINMTGNAGTILGPLVGLLFSVQQFPMLSLISGLMFALIGIILLLLPIKQKMADQNVSFRSGIKQITSNHSLLFIIGLMIPFHFIHQQLFLTYPIIATELTGSSGWMFTLITILVIVGQMSITKHTKQLSTSFLVTRGYFILSITFLPLFLFEHPITLVLSLVGIAFAVMLIQPTFHSYIVGHATSATLGIYLGFSNLAMAIGGAFGNLFGGSLYDLLSEQNQSKFYWLLLALLCIVACLFGHKQQSREAAASD
ncbi:DHA1 family multidrug resistance protein-like MFS transporter [Alkalicoccobacillus murimartini]|uniref:DHA1 family multidrug resistance protein-like MFS transporter n=1 Tax=Alkalicoccobacillus murimartini TaxID=171685 RepID=A0ABT9YFZ8_9BACI|nr:DHA1 family multidrug resistance protein-like MFS transporter [Alkalicoccobacillus murimartini]